MYMCLNFTIYIKIILVFYFNICFSQSSNNPKNIKTIILKNSKSVAPYINLEDSIELPVFNYRFAGVEYQIFGPGG